MAMPDRKTIVRAVLLAFYFLVVFLIFLVLQFPYDRIKGRLEAEVRKQTSLELTVARISPRFLNRFELADVVLADRNGKVLFESPSVRARIAMLPFLWGTLSLDLEGAAYGGSLKVRTQQGAKRNYLAVEANDIEIIRYAPLRDLGLKLAGRMGGNFEMTNGAGKGRVWFKNLSSRELKVQGFPVPDLDFEQGWIEAELRNNDRLTVKKLELNGKELTIGISGDLTMRERGTMNLDIKFKPAERLAREQAGLLSLLKNRDTDGFYHFSLGGTMNNPVPRF